MVQEEKEHLPGEVAPRQLPNCIDPTLVLNPNKAVLTLDPRGKILTVNDMTTLLLGEDLVRDGATLFDLLARPSDAAIVRSNLNSHSHPPEAPPGASAISGPDKTVAKARVEVAAEQDVLDEAGMIVFSGNVVSVRADGDVGEMPISLWMKELPTEVDEEATWIAVIEPITITVAKVTVNRSGLILDADQNFLVIFGSEALLDNDNLFRFISSLKLPEEQNEEWEDHPCTGCTKEGDLFPLSVSVALTNTKDYRLADPPQEKPLFDVKVKLFSNISGLVIVDENGIILQYNHNFTRLLFGYGSKELEGQSIIHILPEFPKVSCRHRPVNKNLFGIHPLNDENVPLKGPDVDSIATKDSFLPYASQDPSFKVNSRFGPPEYPLSNSEKSSGLLDAVDSSNEGVAHPMANHSNDLNANLNGSSSPNKAFILSDSSQFSCSTLPTRSSPQKLSSVSLTSNPSFIQGLHKAPSESLGSPIQTGATPAHVMRDITNSLAVFNTSECLDQSRFPPNLSLLTSTPSVVKGELMIEEGSYFGVGKHKDGSTISILYQVRRLNLGGKDRFCLWITWEPTDSSMDESKHRFPTSSLGTPASHSTRSVITKESVDKSIDASPCTRAFPQGLGIATSFSDEDEDTSASITRTDGSSCNDYSLSHSFRSVKQRSFSENDLFGRGLDGSKHAISTAIEEPEWILTSGDYISRYTILKQIGKGAFGYVKMSYRNSDGLIVITKFIKKSQVYKDSWTVDLSTGRKLCLEVNLLLKLDHPNIVKALDYFENDKYFQLVMEKWGSGMDLFEFIDRNPALDEPLISYIFRQIVSPLQYLRSLNIIHRDIKDENIIINQAFHIKLIDFGSATYLEPDKKFSQFAGTIEYCSPEVLKGHRYCGPELEVWSLGITLYTLVFGENPFSTVEQVLKDPLIMPISYSDDLFTLLDGMLKKNPKERMSLDDVANHYWTRQSVDLEFYSFEDIVPCENYELSPPKYVSDCGYSEESLSTTSSSFVYEERRSQSATESSFLHNYTYGATFRLPEEEEDEATANTEGIKVTANSSRTSTHSASSLKSSITIDSSVFFVSPGKWPQKKTQSILSDYSDPSTSEISRTPSNPSSSSLSSCHKRSTKQISGSLFSLTSLSSSNPSRSSSSTSSTSCNSSDKNSTSSCDTFSSSSATSSNSGRSNTTSSCSSSSSLGSQETVSVNSNSQEDDQTLANTFTNVLVLGKEEEEEEENHDYFNHG